MKTLSCEDMGVKCDFVTKDETEEGVIKKLQAHAAAAHPEEVKKMSESMTEEEMMDAMREKIKDED